MSPGRCTFEVLCPRTARVPVPLDRLTAQLHVLAGGQVDGERLGIPNQNGATYFLQRFALCPHGGYNPVSAMTFAVEHQNPLVTGAASGGGDSPYAATSFSLLKVSNPNVLLWALKPAEGGVSHGLVARLWNLSSAPEDFSLSLDVPGRRFASVRSATHIETDLGDVPVTDGSYSAHLAWQQLRTFRLILE